MMTYTMFARTIIDPKLHTVLRCKIFLTFLDSFYSKTNQMHQCIKLILFGTDTCMFWTVFPSIIRSSRLYIQQQAFVEQILGTL